MFKSHACPLEPLFQNQNCKRHFHSIGDTSVSLWAKIQEVYFKETTNASDNLMFVQIKSKISLSILT